MVILPYLQGKGRTLIQIQPYTRLLAINAVSLVFALVANLALLFNMARRFSFAVAQPITIVGWYVSSFLLIAIVVAASARLRLPSPPNHVFTQAFYFGIIAAVLYFIVASLMVINVYGAYRGRYSKEFKLTTSQRTLMLQTITFLIYVLLGALVFSRVEGWNYLDAVYWADVTLLTIGFGDFTPTTRLGRALVFPFSFLGIVFLGLVIGSIRALVLERGREKLEVRMTEKARERAIRSLNWKKGTIKFNWFSKDDLKTENISDEDRLKQEFYIMRKLQVCKISCTYFLRLYVFLSDSVQGYGCPTSALDVSCYFSHCLVCLVAGWSGRLLEGGTQTELVLLSVHIFLLCGLADHRLWRPSPQYICRQSLLRLLVVAGSPNIDYTDK